MNDNDEREACTLLPRDRKDTAKQVYIHQLRLRFDTACIAAQRQGQQPKTTTDSNWKCSKRTHSVELLLQGVGDLVTAQVAAGNSVGAVEAIGVQCNLHTGNEVIDTQSIREILRHL